MHSRIALHSVFTATSAVVALRMGSGSPWWTGVAWYFGSFVGAHVVMVPFLTAWYATAGRIERWIRSIVEEELIRFDLQNYERQLQRVFPKRDEPPDDRTPG